jgi:hypothetical protein
MDILFKLLAVLDFFMALATAVAAVVTAVRCGQKKLAPVAAWVLVAGFGVLLFTSFAYAALEFVPFQVLGLNVHQAIMLLAGGLGLVGMIAVAVGIGLFSAKPASAGGKVGHG